MTASTETATKPSRSRTVKVVLLVVLSAVLATVIFLVLQYNSKVDKIADLACASMALGSTWEDVRADIADESLMLRVSAGVIEKCPELALAP